MANGNFEISSTDLEIQLVAETGLYPAFVKMIERNGRKETIFILKHGPGGHVYFEEISPEDFKNKFS